MASNNPPLVGFFSSVYFVLYIHTVQFDMMRARQKGVVVPRHNVGMLRAVRGTLVLRDVRDARLNRYVRTASFHCSSGEVLSLSDACLVHASSEMLVINGFEQDTNVACQVVDYAQSWILMDVDGVQPEPSMGPPFPR